MTKRWIIGKECPRCGTWETSRAVAATAEEAKAAPQERIGGCVGELPVADIIEEGEETHLTIANILVLAASHVVLVVLVLAFG